MLSLKGAVDVGDRVQFVEFGFPRTGHFGTVEGCTPYTAFVMFDNGVPQTWPKHYFEKAIEPLRSPITEPPPRT